MITGPVCRMARYFSICLHLRHSLFGISVLRRSNHTLRQRLILSTDFERYFVSYFSLDRLYFFIPFYVTSDGFEALGWEGGGGQKD